MSKVIWQPQPGPQTSLLSCPCFEVFFGGARGGGKTDGALGEWLSHQQQVGNKAAGLMVRRERTQFQNTIKRSRELFTPIGAKFDKSENKWTMPNGSELVMAYLRSDSDAENYQGWNNTRVYVEEIGNFPDPDPVLKLIATCRSNEGVPVGFRATGNPGGPGHQWVKQRYIDAAPLGNRVVKYYYDGVVRDRVFIPSRVTDNHKINQKEYIAQLRMMGSESLVRAWLNGDWNAVIGAYFSEELDIYHPFKLPSHWVRFRAMDWGSAKPFSVGWYAVVEWEPGLPRGWQTGDIVRYKEWYGMEDDRPNVGLKLTVEEFADGIREMDGNDKIRYSVGDPAMKKADGGPSIIERMFKRGVAVAPGDNQRLAGWQSVRSHLKQKKLKIFSNCQHLIRTLPSLQHDPRKPEDLDTESEDHAADELRYALMSRARPGEKQMPPKPPEFTNKSGKLTIGNIIDMADALEARRQAETSRV